MQLKSTCLLIGAALFALPTLTQAQPTAHYPPGLEGIKAASLPPPGVYLKDYNYFYYSDRLNDPSGHEIGGLNTRAFIYANVPRVIWITDVQVLGGYLGVDGLLPLQYTDLRLDGVINDRTFGIGDFFLEGTWSRHIKQFDLALGYGVFAPTGDSANGPTTRAGLGYWTHMLTAGATWYIDADKLWAISALNRYEFNMEHGQPGTTPGQAYTVEGGLSRTLCKNYDLGVVAYYQQKVTTDSGFYAKVGRDRVAGVGPEISVFCPKFGLFTSLRYLYEFMAEGTANGRLQGHTIALTLTRRF